MGTIGITVLVLGTTGIIAAVVLYFVARRFHVYENPKIAEIEDLLPGANCGGCGLSGCHAFAKACAEAESLDGLTCVGAGPDIMQKISAITGMAAEAATRQVAEVRCDGTCAYRDRRNRYDGLSSCALEASLYQGESDCVYGCLGCGDCVESCIFDAISINPEKGVPEVDFDKCTGCGKCIKACPRDIITLVGYNPEQPVVWVACRNTDRGAVALKECEVSCIGCGKCKRACPADAIEVTSFLASIDSGKCIGCGECIEQCPRHSILSRGILRPALRPGAAPSGNHTATDTES